MKVPVRIGDFVTYKEGNGFINTKTIQGRIMHFKEWPKISIKWLKPHVFAGSYSVVPKELLVVYLKKGDPRWSQKENTILHTVSSSS